MINSNTPEFKICGVRIETGETREIYLKVSESYLSRSIHVPVTVIRGSTPGPVAFVTAAVHGDEINGADIVRRLILSINHDKLSGTVIAVPVANIQGFLTQSRYLPYHRDLNRFFPGKRQGNNAERVAWCLFREVVSRCDFGVDIHTAAAGRINLPHVRGDMSHAQVRKLALAFGTSVLVDQVGPRGSLRKEATKKGIPTILFEAGETGKFSRKVSLTGLRGLLNVLSAMGMWRCEVQAAEKPPFKVIVKASDWIRAEKGGILDLSVRPGELVYQDDVVGSVLDPFGKTVTRIRSPATGIIIGVTSAPLTIPGTGVIHIARLKRTLQHVEHSIGRDQKRKRKKNRKTVS